MLLKEFYTDPNRAASREVKFGSQWRLEGEGLWEVLWLEATGELVAISLAALNEWEPSNFGGGGFGGDAAFLIEAATEGIRRFVSHGAHSPADPAGVLILGVERDLLRIRGALAGWENYMREENSLTWLAERVDELSHGHAS